MKKFLIKNLCDTPRDYPLISGKSIYLGAGKSATDHTEVAEEDISQAIKKACSKGFLLIEEKQEEKEVSE